MRRKLVLLLVITTLAIMTTACGTGDRNSDEVQGTTQDTAGMVHMVTKEEVKLI